MMDLLRYFRNDPIETRSIPLPDSYSVSDPAFAEFLGISTNNSAGVAVNESSSLGLTAVFRSVSLIAGTIATLPLKTYRRLPDDSRERVASVIDDPGGPDGLLPSQWVETVMLHLLLHGNAYLQHIYNNAGSIMALMPIHPMAVTLKVEGGQKVFTVQLQEGGQRVFTTRDMTHIMGLSLDGIRGLSPIAVARNAIGTGIAGNDVAAGMLANGLKLGGLVTAKTPLNKEQAEAIKERLQRAHGGPRNAGEILVSSSDLAFSSFSMTAEDAEFLESRKFSVSEIARLYGVPKVLLAEDGASTWGAGIAQLLNAMQKFTLAPWTIRVEEALSRLLARPRYVEFEYGGLFKPTPAEVSANMKLEIEAGILTVNEARAMMNRKPLTDEELAKLAPKPQEVTNEPS
jgi:HK97 family phage portal protein